MTGSEEGLGLVQDLFGNDLDAVIVDPDVDKHGAKCQQQVLLSASKIYDFILKNALKAKKLHLRCSRVKAPKACTKKGIPAITDSGGLQQAITDFIEADEKNRIAKLVASFAGKIVSRCVGYDCGRRSPYHGDSGLRRCRVAPL